AIEVLWVEKLQNLRHRKWVDEDRSQDRHLRVEVVRWYPPCGEWKRGRHGKAFQRSCVTITLTCASTSRCSLSGTLCSPSVLIGSFRSILCRSISTRCCALSAAAMSWFVIEPKALSSAPIFNRTTTVLLSISSATACASSRSFVSRLTATSRSRFASVSAPLPAATARLRRSRNLRPYPSATSFTSPARPRSSPSFVSKTRTSPDLRHGLVCVAVADSRTDSIDQLPHPVARSSNSIAKIAIPDALLCLQQGLVLAPDVLRACVDERLNGENPQGQHVQLADHRDPGGQV